MTIMMIHISSRSLYVLKFEDNIKTIILLHLFTHNLNYTYIPNCLYNTSKMQYQGSSDCTRKSISAFDILKSCFQNKTHENNIGKQNNNHSQMNTYLPPPVYGFETNQNLKEEKCEQDDLYPQKRSPRLVSKLKTELQKNDAQVSRRKMINDLLPKMYKVKLNDRSEM